MKVSTIQESNTTYQHFSVPVFQVNGLKEIKAIERQSKIRCLKTSAITIVDTNRPTYMITVEEIRS